MWFFLLDVSLKLVLVVAVAAGLKLCLPRHRPDLERLLWVGVLLAAVSLIASWWLLPNLHLGWLQTTPRVDHAGSAVAPSVVAVAIESDTAWSAVDWAMGIYLAGVAACGLRLLLSYALTLRLLRAATVVQNARLRGLAFELADEFKLSGPVDLRLSAQDHSPLTLGWLRPKIVLPQQALHWSDERLRAVMLHEVAHIRSGDFPLLMLMRLLTTLFWFHPLLWLAQRQLVKACEHASDAFVVASGMKASSYADHLLQIARSLREGRTGFVPAMARISELEGRLIAVLDAALPRSQRYASLRGALVATVMLIASGLGSLKPWSATVADFGLADSNAPLVIVEDLRTTCMFANSTLDRGPEEAATVSLQHYTYFVQDAECAADMASVPAARYAVDPYSGQPVDKADSVVARLPHSSYLVYFANMANFKAFNQNRGG